MAAYGGREGKALAPASQLCSSCERETAHRYCPECTSALCQHCERGHKKNKYTKDHKIINLGELVKSQTGTQLKNTVKCKKHLRDVQQICDDCVVLLCAECQREHRGHKMSGIGNDPIVLQNVCTEEVKRLLDLGIDLQKDKKVCEDLMKKYEETNIMIQQKGENLIQTIKACLNEFERQTKQSKDRMREHLNDKSSGVINLIKQSDEQVKKLTDLRRIGNIDIVLYGVVESVELNNKGKQRQRLIVAENNSEEMRAFFEKNYEGSLYANDIIQQLQFPFPKPKMDVAIMSTTWKLKHKIVLPKNSGKHGWRFCLDSYSIILYDRCGTDILNVDLDTRLYTRSTLKMASVYRMSCIDANEGLYIAFDENKNCVYFLNNKFEIVDSHATVLEDSLEICSIVPLDPGKFLICYAHDEWNFSKITYMEVLKEQITKGKTDSIEFSLTMGAVYHEGEDFMTIINGDDMFFKLNKKDLKISPYNMQPHNSLIYGLDQDGAKNFVIGYENGDIRIFNEEKSFDRIILKTGLEIKSLKLTRNRLLICDKRNIYVYE